MINVDVILKFCFVLVTLYVFTYLFHKSSLVKSLAASPNTIVFVGSTSKASYYKFDY